MDGAGKPWVRADVAISNGRITKVGRVAGKGAKEIDVGYRLAWPRAETGSHHLARLTTGFMIYSGA